MLETAFILLVAVVVLALVFDFVNGFHDAANAIATVVATRALSARNAVIFGAVLNFAGALMGTKVAATIGSGLVNQTTVTMPIVACALISAIGWNLFTWYKGLPSSSSHALIGSLLGAVYFGTAAGQNNVQWHTFWEKVVHPMLISPVAGFFCAFILMFALTWAVHKVAVSRLNAVFGKLQILSAGVMALSHGHNDAQKSMGIIALALVVYHPQEAFTVPLWVIISCAVAMALGTMMGGWRIIRTLGTKMLTLRPIHGFAAETTSAALIMGASSFGIPLSTTQVITSTIMGVGATKRLSSVRWPVVAQIVWAWLLTLPVTFAIAGGIAYSVTALSN
jgi:inorganic phosphate transporter, PiT family